MVAGKDWGFVVSSPRRNGFNIVATITYSKIGETDISENYANPNLTDAMLAERARQMIQLLKAGDTSLTAITVGPGTIPPPPPPPAVDPRVAVMIAKQELDIATAKSDAKASTDSEVVAALAKLETATTAVATGAAVSAL